MDDEDITKLSEDDCKIVCSQQRFGLPPPIHLLWTCWPIMSLWQKVVVVSYGVVIVFGFIVFLYHLPQALAKWG